MLEVIRRTVDDRLFTSSGFQLFRNNARMDSTRKKLDALIALTKETAAQLDFEGVFIDSNQPPQRHTHKTEGADPYNMESPTQRDACDGCDDEIPRFPIRASRI
jgi:hypothetical protein